MPDHWTLLFHRCLLDQLERLKTAADRAVAKNAETAAENANVKLFAALAKLILETVPNDPSRDEYRQGNTMGSDYRHWRRARFGRRFRLIFRYDSQSRVIIYAWVKDDKTLRTAGSKNDPYAVFKKMLDQGDLPDDWQALLAQSSECRVLKPGI